MPTEIHRTEWDLKKKCLIVYKKTDLYFWDKTASCNRGNKAKTFR